MHELGQPPTEVVGEGGNPMMPDLNSMFGVGQVSFVNYFTLGYQIIVG